MDLRHIRYFRVVSELGSLTQAAHTLGISQPSLSKQIRQMETELGIALLIRDGRGVKLTPAGAELYQRLAEVDDKLSEAILTVSQMAKGPSTIAIGATTLLGTEFLTDVVRVVGEASPSTEIRLVEGYSQQVAAWLQSGRLDIALLYGVKASQQVEEILRVEQDLFLIEVAGQDDRPIPFDALSAYPLIAFDQPSRLRARFERAGEATGTLLTFRHAIDSLPVMKMLLQRGEGTGGLPFSAVAEEVSRGSLTARPIEGPHMTLELRLLASRRSGLGQDIYDVCALLKALLSDRCASGRWRGSRLGA